MTKFFCSKLFVFETWCRFGELSIFSSQICCIFWISVIFKSQDPTARWVSKRRILEEWLFSQLRLDLKSLSWLMHKNNCLSKLNIINENGLSLLEKTCISCTWFFLRKNHAFLAKTLCISWPPVISDSCYCWTCQPRCHFIPRISNFLLQSHYLFSVG